MIFNTQKIYNKQPMVLIAIGLIIGILIGSFKSCPTVPNIIFILLTILIIITRRWKYSYITAIIIPILLGIFLFNNNNNNFEKSLGSISKLSEHKYLLGEY